MPSTTSDIATFEEFIEQAKGYLNDKQLEFVRSAYILAADAHKEQRRKSGEPYIIHPIGVASILASLQMDEYTLAAAFLHDVVEDTEYTFDDIRNIFGTVVANLVDGVTKLGKIAYLIFTILILPIHEHGIFLHVLVSSLISFTSVL